jgi:hypothetical protein
MMRVVCDAPRQWRRHSTTATSRSYSTPSGEYITLKVAEQFGVGRSTVYRAIERQRVEARPASRR